jgi:ferredoxin
MIIMLKKPGESYPDELRTARVFPAEGVFAMVECIEEIPCNPCETVCPEEAVTAVL